MDHSLGTTLTRKRLTPLRKRPVYANKRAVMNALQRLEDQYNGRIAVSELKPKFAEKKDWRREADVIKSVRFTVALYQARRILRHEYFFFATMPVELIHEERWTQESYPEVEEIGKKMRLIEDEQGLAEDEYWPAGGGPMKYRNLAKKYDQKLQARLLAAYREFGLQDIADLAENYLDEFDRLRERGRRSIFYAEALMEALKDAVLHYEDQAQKAAKAGAYSAAIIALGSGVEGLLVLRCLRSKKKALKTAASLPKRHRPQQKFLDDPTTWTFDTLIETCLAAGWLEKFTIENSYFNPASIAHVLRLMRNNVHPGKIARDQPWWEAHMRDFDDAHAMYLLLMSRIII